MGLSAVAFERLAALLRARSGLALGPDKIYLLETRLAPLLRRERLRDLTALAERLATQAGAGLVREVVEAMTTNESLFFRDVKPFAHFRERALPALLAARPADVPLRIWSAAASTGQEAYSLAMILAECRPMIGARRVEILGTDIAREPLARAREGLYTQFEVQRGLPMQMLVRYFRKEANGWRIVPELRSAVSFRDWNLLDDLAPLGRFDVVFCRNVLIYFDQPTKARVLAAIGRQMHPDGVLYLGAAETLLGLSGEFTSLSDLPGGYRPATASSRGLKEPAPSWPEGVSGVHSPPLGQQEAVAWRAHTGSP